MLTDGQKERLLAGEFELPCFGMVLRKNGGPETVEYRGSGEIRQRDGQLELQLFDENAEIRSPGLWVAGELIPTEDYYTLTARDLVGGEWTAEYLLPQITQGQSGTVVRAILRELRSDSVAIRARVVNRVELTIAEPLRLPANTLTRTQEEAGERRSFRTLQDTAEFEAAGLQFHCRVLVDRTIISAQGSGAAIDDNIDLRIIETLQFVLGREVWPTLVRTFVAGSERERIFSPPHQYRGERNGNASIQSPLELRTAGNADFWKLFDKYLTYVVANQNDGFHPISSAWHAVLQSANSDIEAQALAAAVAVEALLNVVDEEGKNLPPSLSEGDRLVAGWIERVFSLIEDIGCPTPIQNRIRGFFKPLFQMSPVNRLKRLAEARVIDGGSIPSWTLLRNTRAHGSNAGFRSVAEAIAAHAAVIGLCYQLIYYGIGYTGEFINYAKRNWPNEIYPDALRG